MAGEIFNYEGYRVDKPSKGQRLLTEYIRTGVRIRLWMGGQVHIIPAAGSATRMGGIPKFLLQVGSPGKSLLKPHLEMSLAANLSARVIGRFFIVNPSLGIKGL
jgi:hypothetical protein